MLKVRVLGRKCQLVFDLSQKTFRAAQSRWRTDFVTAFKMRNQAFLKLAYKPFYENHKPDY